MIPARSRSCQWGSSRPPWDGARRLLALEVFREGRASLGRAAELAGLGIEEFMTFAAEREVPLHYTLADLDQDRRTACQLGR